MNFVRKKKKKLCRNMHTRVERKIHLFGLAHVNMIRMFTLAANDARRTNKNNIGSLSPTSNSEYITAADCWRICTINSKRSSSSACVCVFLLLLFFPKNTRAFVEEKEYDAKMNNNCDAQHQMIICSEARCTELCVFGNT